MPTIAAGLLGGLSLALAQEILGIESIIERGAHSRVMEVTSMDTDRYGSGPRVWQYTEVQNGMHYWEHGEWLETLELIEPFPDGAVARFGPHKLILSPNLNVEGAIDLAMPDGTRMQVQPIGLAWFDAATGQSAWIGLVQDGGGPNKAPHKVSWNPASQLSGTGLSVEVRAANTITGLPSNPFVTVGNNVTFSNVTGRYLEVRVTLWRNPSVANNPRLTDLTVHWPQ